MKRILLVLLALAFLGVQTGGAWARGGSSSGGGRGFSAPSAPARTYTAPSSTTSAAPRAADTSSRGFTAPSAATPPTVRAFDAEAARARAEEASRVAFEAAQQRQRAAAAATAATQVPRPATTASTAAVSPRAQPTPSDVQPAPRPEPWHGWRGTTQQPAAAAVPDRGRPVIVERHYTSSGSGDTNFWLWLLESQRDRAPQDAALRADNDRYIYNHRDRMSDEQMRRLREADAEIDDRLRALEAQGVPRDPTAVHPQYRGQNAPPPVQRDREVASTVSETEGSYLWLWITLLLLGGAAVYLIVLRRPGTSRNGGADTRSGSGGAARLSEVPKAPPTASLFNPLQFALGGYVKVERPGYFGMTFQVTKMAEFTRQIGKKTLRFTDYVLQAGPEHENKEIVIRAMPQGKEVQCFILVNRLSTGYDADLVAVLEGDELRDDDTGLTYRKEGVYDARIREVGDDIEGVHTLDIKYWTFVREGGDGKFGLYIVEMDQTDRKGWIDAYVGTSCPTADVVSLAGHTLAA